MIDGPIQRENLYDMDNKNKQDPNMKSNWQTITMLLIAALLTFGLDELLPEFQETPGTVLQ